MNDKEFLREVLYATDTALEAQGVGAPPQEAFEGAQFHSEGPGLRKLKGAGEILLATRVDLDGQTRGWLAIAKGSHDAIAFGSNRRLLFVEPRASVGVRFVHPVETQGLGDYYALVLEGSIGHLHFHDALVHSDRAAFVASIEEHFDPEWCDEALSSYVQVYVAGHPTTHLDLRDAATRDDSSAVLRLNIDAMQLPQVSAPSTQEILSLKPKGWTGSLSVATGWTRL